MTDSCRRWGLRIFNWCEFNVVQISCYDVLSVLVVIIFLKTASNTYQESAATKWYYAVSSMALLKKSEEILKDLQKKAMTNTSIVFSSLRCHVVRSNGYFKDNLSSINIFKSEEECWDYAIKFHNYFTHRTLVILIFYGLNIARSVNYFLLLLFYSQNKQILHDGWGLSHRVSLVLVFLQTS